MADDSAVVTAIDRAAPYARFGLSIFPVQAVTKEPMPGYGWVALATSKMNEVVEDFDRAAQLWGDENVSVGWALGLDDHVATDLDLPYTEWPQWAIDLSGYAAINITRRGQHLIFKFPAGMKPGNGAPYDPDGIVGFPTEGWGEVRGYHGYIVIDGPDRPGLSLAEFDHCQEFPHPAWLREFGGSPEMVSLTEVATFANQHAAVGTMPNKINGIQTFCDNWNPEWAHDPRKGRHPSAIWVLTTLADEAIDGYYPYKAGYDIVRAWWKRVTADEPERHGREWNGLVTWSVSKALMNHQRPETVADAQDVTPDDALLGDNNTLIDPSFLPVDLTDVLSGRYIAPQPSILKRDDRQALLYRGQINGVHGDSGLGKGWVALFAAAEQLLAGNTVMMLDLEDVPSSIVGRLRLLNVHDQALRERFVYIRPQAAFDPTHVEHLVRLVRGRRPSLVIIDSLGEAFGLEGVDENHDNEVGPWLRRVPRRLADVTDDGYEGPAVLIVDHVTKVNDNPLHPSGSKRKRAAVGGAQYWLQAPDPLSADKGGRLRLICAKDRHGTYARNEHVADLVIRIDPVSWEARLYSPLPVDDSVTARLTRAVNRAVSTLAEHGKPASRNALALMMGGRRQESFEAIKLATESGAMETGSDGKLRLPTWPSAPGTEPVPDFPEPS